MPLSRKHFVAAATLGVSGVAIGTAGLTSAAEETGAPHFHILTPAEFDHKAVMNTLMVNKSHKQVFQNSSSVELAPGLASLYLHMQNSMNAHEFSFGFGRRSLATLGIVMGPAITLALDDATWKKYGIGDALKLAPTNVYYKAHSLKYTGSPDAPDSIYQDWSAEAILHRGGTFMVCHNAMTFAAGMIAQKAGSSPQAVLSDFERHVLPGFQIVPAGVAMVQLAQQHGWTLFALG